MHNHLWCCTKLFFALSHLSSNPSISNILNASRSRLASREKSSWGSQYLQATTHRETLLFINSLFGNNRRNVVPSSHFKIVANVPQYMLQIAAQLAAIIIWGKEANHLKERYNGRSKFRKLSKFNISWGIMTLTILHIWMCINTFYLN